MLKNVETTTTTGKGKTSGWQHPAVLAVLGAVLLSAGWLPWPWGPAALLLFGAWLPYLVLERNLTREGARKGRVFAYTYFLLLLWNAFTTWWVSYSTLGGGVAAVVLNALLMCLPLMAFRQTKKRFGARWGYISLPIYWIAFEQLHLRWDITWPWLTLGNGFAAAPQWVQWYEYTGFLGGSVWVWAVNLLLFFWLKPEELPVKREELRGGGRLTTLNLKLVAALLAIAVPIGLSYLIGATYQEKGPVAEVVVVQPNVDPYTQKFQGGADFISYDEQVTRLLTLSERQLTPQTRLVLWPETALEESYWENTIESNPKILRIKQWLARHPGVALLTGITSVVSYPDKETAQASSPTFRYRDDLGYYDVCNAGAFFADATAPVQFYHKERLVPGVEKIPPLLTSLISHIDLGGTVGSYCTIPATTVLQASAVPALRVRPLICYELIYGDFTAEYVRRGGTLLGIITNDAWWHDSPGYRQLLRYGGLRAIETRRDVARAANTGFTGYFNQRGELTRVAPTWVPTSARATVHLNEELTFYVRVGEWIGRGAQGLAVLGLVAMVLFSMTKKSSSNPAA